MGSETDLHVPGATQRIQEGQEAASCKGYVLKNTLYQSPEGNNKRAIWQEKEINPPRAHTTRRGGTTWATSKHNTVAITLPVVGLG